MFSISLYLLDVRLRFRVFVRFGADIWATWRLARRHWRWSERDSIHVAWGWGWRFGRKSFVIIEFELDLVSKTNLDFFQAPVLTYISSPFFRLHHSPLILKSSLLLLILILIDLLDTSAVVLKPLPAAAAAPSSVCLRNNTCLLQILKNVAILSNPSAINEITLTLTVKRFGTSVSPLLLFAVSGRW